METRRWTNPSQPQTLYLAVILLYINAVLGIVFGLLLGIDLLGLLLVVGAVAAGLGIANEQRWGYILGVAMATLAVGWRVLLPLVTDGPGMIFNMNYLFGAVFPIALFALLIHPMSREYQRIWFK